MKCTDCKFCVLEDNGYSNYTVEGTDVTCLLNMNAAFPVDRWYDTTEELDFANICPRFKQGEPIDIDVEQEHGHMINYTDDPEVKEIIEKQMMWAALQN